MQRAAPVAKVVPLLERPLILLSALGTSVSCSLGFRYNDRVRFGISGFQEQMDAEINRM